MAEPYSPWKTIRSRIIHKNKWITLYEDAVIKPDGTPGTYTYTQSPPFVLIIGIDAEHFALVANGVMTVGVYSTTAQWNDITGSWQNNWPSWGATTWSTASQAQRYCTGHQFTGGPSYLMQYTPRRTKLDQDVAC